MNYKQLRRVLTDKSIEGERRQVKAENEQGAIDNQPAIVDKFLKLFPGSRIIARTPLKK